jgi:hypothetical protein
MAAATGAFVWAKAVSTPAINSRRRKENGVRNNKGISLNKLGCL